MQILVNKTLDSSEKKTSTAVFTPDLLAWHGHAKEKSHFASDMKYHNIIITVMISHVFIKGTFLFHNQANY